MLYASYARGYKAGGFNLDRSSYLGIFPGMTATQARTGLTAIDPGSIGFEPETVDSFELGMRSTILNGTTFFNVTLFYSQLHDYQLNAFNGTAFITRNIPEAISQGVEIDILSRLTRNLTIQGGINYTDAYNDSTVSFSPSPADTIVEGTPLVQAPEWSLTGAITYELPINDNLMARFYLDGRYDSEYQTQALGRNPISDMDSTVILNGRIGLGSPAQNWAIELWGRNLTDELVYGGFNAPLQSGTIGAYTNEPQTYGVTVRARY
jgi:outer membrane receptor protein involved in Fe transport